MTNNKKLGYKIRIEYADKTIESLIAYTGTIQQIQQSKYFLRPMLKKLNLTEDCKISFEPVYSADTQNIMTLQKNLEFVETEE